MHVALHSHAVMPGQGGLAFASAFASARRPYRPDLDGFVPTAADEVFAILSELDRRDAMFEMSQQVKEADGSTPVHTHKKSPAGVPSKARSASTSRRIP